MTHNAENDAACGECPHAPTSHSEYGDGCDECSCMLSAREATEGRDEEKDESIRQAFYEDALIEGYDPEPIPPAVMCPCTRWDLAKLPDAPSEHPWEPGEGKCPNTPPPYVIPPAELVEPNTKLGRNSGSVIPPEEGHSSGGTGHDWMTNAEQQEAYRTRPIPPGDTYICPTTGETDSRTMGGFDVCCDDPACPGSRPIPPGDGRDDSRS